MMKNKIDGSESDMIRSWYVFGNWIKEYFLRKVQPSLKEKV